MVANLDSAEQYQDTIEADTTPKRNFVVMALFQIGLRIGWVFKTESIIMPAVLDSLGGPAWLRGMLPMLNRIGQSIPPVLLADRLNRVQRKKWALLLFAGGMSVAFLALSMLWRSPTIGSPTSQVTFLVCYAFFFACTGMTNLTFGVLQGKLIPVTSRGRLLMTANALGAICAISFAAWLMPNWLNARQFAQVFAFTSFAFAISAFIVIAIKEVRDIPGVKSDANSIKSILAVLKHDPAYRHALMMAFCFGVSMTVFPHYQALARERLNLSFESMTRWVIIQNIGTGLFGIFFGLLADWKGNRAVLRISIFGVAMIPLVAIGLSRSATGASFFWIVFALFSLTPVTIKTLNNFALEFTDSDSHSRYLSLMAISIAFPIYFAPVFGLVIQRFGFDIPLLVVASVVAIGWLLAIFVSEPRHTRVRHGQ